MNNKSEPEAEDSRGRKEVMLWWKVGMERGPDPGGTARPGCRAAIRWHLNTNRAYYGVPRWKVENVPEPGPWTPPFSGSVQPVLPVLSHSFCGKATN